jgi:hypothetical protein
MLWRDYIIVMPSLSMIIKLSWSTFAERKKGNAGHRYLKHYLDESQRA